MIDTTSPTWIAIQAWLQRELDDARVRNDQQHSEAATAALRGRIAMLKDLLQLPERIEQAQAARDASAGQYQQPTFMTPTDY